jgi:hypothetical protein
MTFTPTPPDQLPTLAQLYDVHQGFDQILVSYLAKQETLNAGVLASISDLYQHVGGRVVDSQWIWADDATATGTFHIALGAGENERIVSLNRHDADSDPITLGGFVPGSTMVLMDDPATPPVTAFRQYVCASRMTDHGDWWSFSAVRVATFGAQSIPSDGERISLLFG